LIGATAGRTTLGGEGLQHQDGSSHVMAALIPNCRAYDPAFAGELAVILDHGARQMLERGEDVFYYVTVMNESYAQPSLAKSAHEGVIRGMYRFAAHDIKKPHGSVRLLGSGAILREVIAAAELLASDWKLSSEIWSVTSFSELARDAREVERWNRLNSQAPARLSYLEECLPGNVPIVAATDYVRAYPQMIGCYLEASFRVLGTDGFGRSDTRAALRRFFEVDRHHIVLAVLQSLTEQGVIPRDALSRALDLYTIDATSAASWMT
jgi:pyruvate dehydrogenase E1 component